MRKSTGPWPAIQTAFTPLLREPETATSKMTPVIITGVVEAGSGATELGALETEIFYLLLISKQSFSTDPPETGNRPSRAPCHSRPEVPQLAWSSPPPPTPAREGEGRCRGDTPHAETSQGRGHPPVTVLQSTHLLLLKKQNKKTPPRSYLP